MAEDNQNDDENLITISDKDDTAKIDELPTSIDENKDVIVGTDESLKEGSDEVQEKELEVEAKEQPEEVVENEGEKEVVIEVLDEDNESDEGEVPINRRRNLRDTGDSSEEDNVREVQSELSPGNKDQSEEGSDNEDDWEEGSTEQVFCEDKEQQEEQEGDEGISKDSPMYVPKGPYYCHDSRFDNIDEEQEEEGDETQKKKEDVTPTRSQCQVVDKWEHDLYNEEDQKPRKQWEKERDRKYYEDQERRRASGERGRRGNKNNRLQDYISPNKDRHYEVHRNDRGEYRERRGGRGGYRGDRRREQGEYRREQVEHRGEQGGGRGNYRGGRYKGGQDNRREGKVEHDKRDGGRERYNKAENWTEDSERDRRGRQRQEERHNKSEENDSNILTEELWDDDNISDDKKRPVPDQTFDTEITSLFKPMVFTSKVFSLSGQSNRLIVKDVDNKRFTKTDSRRMGGRGRGRTPITTPSQTSVGHSSATYNDVKKTELSKEKETDKQNDILLPIKTESNPLPNVNESEDHSNIADTASNDTPTDTLSFEQLPQSISDQPTQEASEIEGDSKTGKPKRYSSQRQKTGGVESDNVTGGESTNESGGHQEHIPRIGGDFIPSPFQYGGWMYPPPPMLPMDPAVFQQQQQQMMMMQNPAFMHQQMLMFQRMFQDMYQQPGAPPMPLPGGPIPIIPSPPIPEHYPSPSPYPPPSMSELKPPPSTDSALPSGGESTGLFVPQIGPEQQRLLQKTSDPTQKASQAIPIVAPEENSN